MLEHRLESRNVRLVGPLGTVAGNCRSAQLTTKEGGVGGILSEVKAHFNLFPVFFILFDIVQGSEMFFRKLECLVVFFTQRLGIKFGSVLCFVVLLHVRQIVVCDCHVVSDNEREPYSAVDSQV